MRQHRWVSFLLLIVMMVVIGRPVPALAAGELQVTALIAEHGQVGYGIDEKVPIDRLITGIDIDFNTGLQQPPQPGWVEVRDSQGKDPGWTIEKVGSSISYHLLTGATPSNPLPPNETYRITVKGGPNGVTSDGFGYHMASDYTATIKTEGPEWSVTGASVSGDLTSGPITEGATVDQGVAAVNLRTSHEIAADSLVGNVSLVNDQGEEMGWQATAENGITLMKGAPLQPDQTYTVRVKGGPDGPKTILGDHLPADYSLSFRTKSGAFHLKTQLTTPQGGPTQLPLTGTIRRDTYNTVFQMDRQLDCKAAVNAVQVTDSQGRPANWKVDCGGPSIVLIVPSDNVGATTMALPRNESFTIRIKGGPDGLKSAGGLTLAEDLVQTVTTEDKAMQINYWQGTPYPGAETKQTEAFHLRAEAGPLKVQVEPLTDDSVVQVILRDRQSGAILLNEWLATGHVERTVTLAHAGEYDLTVGPVVIRNLWLSGTELDTSLVTPVVQLPEMAPFVTKNNPFTILASLLDPTKASTFSVFLNGQELKSVTPTAGDDQISVTIDPAHLTDGIYKLAAGAVAQGTENEAYVTRTFVVDRSETYHDVGKVHWARSYIEVMSHLKILSGLGDGSFGPGKPIRRDEFAKMLAATLNLKAQRTGDKPFVDMKEDWSKPYLQAVYEEGLMKGELVNGQRYFYPERTISRAEAAVAIARAVGGDAVNITGYRSPFKDWESVPTWARPSVAILQELKWINGLPDGTYGPGNTLNRDQAAKLLANFLGMN